MLNIHIRLHKRCVRYPSRDNEKCYDENESIKIRYVYYQDHIGSLNYFPLINHPQLYVIDNLGSSQFIDDQIRRIT